MTFSSITVSELAFGVEKSGSERNKQALNKFLSPLEIILPYDDQAIWHFAKLRQNLQSTGKPIGSLDMLIAVHALAFGCCISHKQYKRI